MEKDSDDRPYRFYKSAELEISMTKYNIVIIVDAPFMLKVEIRDFKSSKEWQGEFSAEYIEELTKKTGNYKPFNIFVSMLGSCLDQSSNELFMSFPSFEELQAACHAKVRHSLDKKFGNNNFYHPPVQNQTFNSTKRCLVITYSTSFDRVQYPLPLQYVGFIDTVKLYQALDDIRSHLYNDQPLKVVENWVQSREDIFKQNEELKSENLELRDQLNHVQILLKKADANAELLNSYSSRHQNFDKNNNFVTGIDNSSLYAQSDVSDGPEVLKKIKEELLDMQKREKSLISQISELSEALTKSKIARGSDDLPPRIIRTRNASGGLFTKDTKRMSRFRSNSPSHSRPIRALISDEDRNSTNRRTVSLDKNISSSRVRKFDPTAYVREQERKKLEIEKKKADNLRNRLRNISPPAHEYRSQTRNNPNHSRSRSLSRHTESSLNRLKARNILIQPRKRVSSVCSSSEEIDERIRNCNRGKVHSSKNINLEESNSVLTNSKNKKYYRIFAKDSMDEGDILEQKMNRFFSSQNPEEKLTHKKEKDSISRNDYHSRFDKKHQQEKLEDDIDRRLAYLQNFLKKYLPE